MLRYEAFRLCWPSLLGAIKNKMFWFLTIVGVWRLQLDIVERTTNKFSTDILKKIKKALAFTFFNALALTKLKLSNGFVA
jgi:hypothetical protein